MNDMQLLTWLSNQSLSNLSIALLHSLWQGLLFALFLYGLLRSIPAKFNNLRYCVSLSALLLSLFSCFITWSILSMPKTEPVWNQGREIVPIHETVRQVLATPKYILSASENPSNQNTNSPIASVDVPWTAWLLSAWIVGVIIMLFRMVNTIVSVNQIRIQSRPVEEERIISLVLNLQKTLGIGGKIQILISDTIKSPAVIGILWPTILLPASMASGLPLETLKSIFTHELAHIRRYDYLINLIQMFFEALLFFNPAVWWINRQIRAEREACCDAAAIEIIGDRSGYLQSLALSADWIRGDDSSFQPLPAFRNDSSNDLIGRIRRIVHPDRCPNLLAPWSGFVVVVFIGVILMACMQQGADYITGKLMVSQEDIDRMEEIQEEYKPEESPSYEDRGTITLSGFVKTEDGAPLQDNLRFEIDSFGVRGSNGTSFKINEDGTFSVTISYGEIYIVSRAEGYPSILYGPYTAEPDEEIKDIELVLKKGFKAKIQFVDEDGSPIPYPIYQAYAWLQRNSGGRSVGEYFKGMGDENGVVEIKTTGSLPHKVECKAPGFQHDEQIVLLEPDEIHTIQLPRSRITSGTVTSKETGLPIPKAEIRYFYRESQGHSWSHGSKREYSETPTNLLSVYANDDGRYYLDFLRDDSTYTYMVLAPNLATGLLDEIKPGQKGRDVELYPEIVANGRIVGFDNSENRPNSLHYYQPFYINGDKKEDSSYAKVQWEGDVGYFGLPGLKPGEVSIRFYGRTFEYDIQSSTDDIVLNYSSPITGNLSSATRTVVIDFDFPKDSPPPKGAIKVNYMVLSKENTGGGRHYQVIGHKDLEIADNQIKLDVPAPGGVSFSSEGMIGYWFKRQFTRPVELADFPQNFTIQAYPAGSIFGKAQREGGQYTGVVKITPLVVEKPKEIEEAGFQWLPEAQETMDEKYSFQPLPLGCKYAVAAQRNNSIVISKIIHLTGSNSIYEQNLVIPDGTTLEGRILDPNGDPLPNKQLNVNLILDGIDRSFSLDNVTTNFDGRFTIRGINLGVRGDYVIYDRTKNDYQPFRFTIPKKSDSFTIRMEKGLKARGIVIEKATGKPVKGAKSLRF